MIRLHELKTERPHFDLTWSGVKNFEVRKDDRHFAPGDLLFLRLHPVPKEKEEDLAVLALVQCVVTYGQPEGQVVLGLARLAKIADDGFNVWFNVLGPDGQPRTELQAFVSKRERK